MDPKIFYGSVLEPYDYFSSEIEHSAELATDISDLVFELEIPKNQLFVDLGCGPGTSFSIYMERGKFSNCLAVDYSKNMLDFFQDMLKEESKSIVKFQQADLETDTIDTSNNSAMLVVAQKVLQYLNKVENFFKESYRILKPKGFLAFDLTGHEEQTLEICDWGPTDCCPIKSYIHSKKSVEEIFRKNKFEIIKKEIIYFGSMNGFNVSKTLYILEKKI